METRIFNIYKTWEPQSSAISFLAVGKAEEGNEIFPALFVQYKSGIKLYVYELNCSPAKIVGMIEQAINDGQSVGRLIHTIRNKKVKNYIGGGYRSVLYEDKKEVEQHCLQCA